MPCNVCGWADFQPTEYVTELGAAPALECLRCGALCLDESVARTPQERDSVKLAITIRDGIARDSERAAKALALGNPHAARSKSALHVARGGVGVRREAAAVTALPSGEQRVTELPVRPAARASVVSPRPAHGFAVAWQRARLGPLIGDRTNARNVRNRDDRVPVRERRVIVAAAYAQRPLNLRPARQLDLNALPVKRRDVFHERAGHGHPRRVRPPPFGRKTGRSTKPVRRLAEEVDLKNPEAWHRLGRRWDAAVRH